MDLGVFPRRRTRGSGGVPGPWRGPVISSGDLIRSARRRDADHGPSTGMKNRGMDIAHGTSHVRLGEGSHPRKKMPEGTECPSLRRVSEQHEGPLRAGHEAADVPGMGVLRRTPPPAGRSGHCRTTGGARCADRTSGGTRHPRASGARFRATSRCGTIRVSTVRTVLVRAEEPGVSLVTILWYSIPVALVGVSLLVSSRSPRRGVVYLSLALVALAVALVIAWVTDRDEWGVWPFFSFPSCWSPASGWSSPRRRYGFRRRYREGRRRDPGATRTGAHEPLVNGGVHPGPRWGAGDLMRSARLRSAGVRLRRHVLRLGKPRHRRRGGGPVRAGPGQAGSRSPRR